MKSAIIFILLGAFLCVAKAKPHAFGMADALFLLAFVTCFFAGAFLVYKKWGDE